MGKFKGKGRGRGRRDEDEFDYRPPVGESREIHAAVEPAAAPLQQDMPHSPAPAGPPGAAACFRCMVNRWKSHVKRARGLLCALRLPPPRPLVTSSCRPSCAAGEQPRTAGLLPPSDSEDESSEESGAEQEQQPKVVMIQVRCAALSRG